MKFPAELPKNFLPCAYPSLPHGLSPGRFFADVVLVQVSPADANDRYCLSVADDLLIATLSRARSDRGGQPSGAMYFRGAHAESFRF